MCNCFSYSTNCVTEEQVEKRYQSCCIQVSKNWLTLLKIAATVYIVMVFLWRAWSTTVISHSQDCPPGEPNFREQQCFERRNHFEGNWTLAENGGCVFLKLWPGHSVVWTGSDLSMVRFITKGGCNWNDRIRQPFTDHCGVRFLRGGIWNEWREVHLLELWLTDRHEVASSS